MIIRQRVIEKRERESNTFIEGEYKILLLSLRDTTWNSCVLEERIKIQFDILLSQIARACNSYKLQDRVYKYDSVLRRGFPPVRPYIYGCLIIKQETAPFVPLSNKKHVVSKRKTAETHAIAGRASFSPRARSRDCIDIHVIHVLLILIMAAN